MSRKIGKLIKASKKRKGQTSSDVARKLEAKSMVDTPNYKGMADVESGKAGKVTVGQPSYLEEVRSKRVRKEKSIKDATKKEQQYKSDIADLEEQIKQMTRLNVGIGKKAATTRI